MGGEKARWYPIKYGGQGSPPRGRGKGQPLLADDFRVGITPAWAGKSFQRQKSLPSCKDHPRVGGEKPASRRSALGWIGSPPRGRGKAAAVVQAGPASGITPAWAGKRLGTACGGSSCRDHPRVGGEKCGVKLRVVNFGRITPAWAGKRRLSRRPAVSGADHPRVGGEKTKKIP